MRGTEKQINYANDLLAIMRREFDECKKIAPESFHSTLDKAYESVSNCDADEIIEILSSNNGTGIDYFKRFTWCLNHNNIKGLTDKIKARMI